MPAPASLQDLYKRTRASAVKRSGASACHVKDVVPVVTANEDGVYWPALQVIGLNPFRVIPWLERFLDGTVVTAAETHHALNAVVAMYHEHIHALGPKTLGPAFGRTIYFHGVRSEGAVDFENGVTELWARTSLTTLLHDTGLDDLLVQPPEYQSPTYVLEMGAVAAVVEKIAELTAANELEVLRLMASHAPDTRAVALGEFLADRRGTPFDRREHVADAFSQAFREVQLVEDITSGDYPGWARTELWVAVLKAET